MVPAAAVLAQRGGGAWHETPPTGAGKPPTSGAMQRNNTISKPVEAAESSVESGVHSPDNGASESGSDGGSDSSKSPMRKQAEAEVLMDETSRESQAERFSRAPPAEAQEPQAVAQVPTAPSAPPAGLSSAESTDSTLLSPSRTRTR